MTSEVVGYAYNYFLPIYFYRNDYIVLNFWKLIKNVLGHVFLMIIVEYKHFFQNRNIITPEEHDPIYTLLISKTT